MKKFKKLLPLLLILIMTFALQGCSMDDITSFSFSDLFKAETSHAVYRNENYLRQFYVDLKTDTTTGYKWYVYMTDSPDQMKETFREGRFNHTNSQLTEYRAIENSDFYLYLVLVKNDDIDGSKCFPYHITADESKVSITEEKSYNLKDEPKVYKLLKPALGF